MISSGSSASGLLKESRREPAITKFTPCGSSSSISIFGGRWQTRCECSRANAIRPRPIPRRGSAIARHHPKCGSPALLPLFIVSIDSGLRASEIRNLRRGDVTLIQPKTASTVKSWCAAQRPKPELAASYRSRAGPAQLSMPGLRASGGRPGCLPVPAPRGWVSGRRRGCAPYAISTPTGRCRDGKALGAGRAAAGVEARWHDLRHTLVSRLAENPTISEETIRSLAGHVSRQMLSRYAHIRAQAKRAAIASLDPAAEGAKRPISRPGPHKSPHSRRQKLSTSVLRVVERS